MAKSAKLTITYPKNTEAKNDIQKFCAEFPELKLIAVEEDSQSFTVDFVFKYPVKIRQYIDLYLRQHDLERRTIYG